MGDAKMNLWWQSGVVYEIYTRSFQDATGDGTGDLLGITRRLDYLSDVLGVDTIWITPFYPSPMLDFGYDISDYENVDPLFGTLGDFDALLDAAHKKNLRVLIDLVPNHTSNQHVWFLESASSRMSPQRNWYIWRDAKPDGGLPNNWQSHFGGSAWEWDEKSDQYYLHTFLTEQPDLNWRNSDVKQAMYDVICFWLDRGVDGFRIDVVNYIMKDPHFRDNPYRPGVDLADYQDYLWAAQNHKYDYGHPDVHIILKEIRKILDSYSRGQPRFSVGEIWESDWSEWAKYYGDQLDQLHMPFNFQLLSTPWNASSVRKSIEGLEAALPSGAWPNYVLGNHDESRLASRFGKEHVRIAAMLLLTLRGTPTIYQGDELGMEDVDIPIEKQQDPYGKRVPGMSRDPCRTPMLWTPERNAGFTGPEAEPWLPLSPDYKNLNVATQLAKQDSLLNLYRRLLAHRRSTPVLKQGSYKSIEADKKNCLVFLREMPGQNTSLVALNFAEERITLDLSMYGAGKVTISTEMDREGVENLGRLALRPYEGVIVDVAIQ